MIETLLVSLVVGFILLVIEYFIIQPIASRQRNQDTSPQSPKSPTRSQKFVLYTILMLLAFIGSPVVLGFVEKIHIPTIQPDIPTTLPRPTEEVQPQPRITSETIRLDDNAWQGGYRYLNRPSIYGGRTATWIYGTSTQFHTMRATFEVPIKPIGTAQLCIEGMNSEGTYKTHIGIKINGNEIFNGSNPLPSDDYDLETGTWSNFCWDIAPDILHKGTNTIEISNLNEGSYSLPPWFMLDYADIIYSYEKR